MIIWGFANFIYTLRNVCLKRQLGSESVKEKERSPIVVLGSLRIAPQAVIIIMSPFVYTEQALANTTTDLKCPQEVLPRESVRERLAKSHMWSLANTSKDSERREAISHAQVLLHNCECSES